MNNFRLKRNITSNRQLEIFESLDIAKCKTSMYSDKGPIPNCSVY